MSTQAKVLKVHPTDNVLVALTNLEKGTVITFEGQEYRIQENVKAKHKFSTVDLAPGDPITMYGVLVGKAQEAIKKGADVINSRGHNKTALSCAVMKGNLDIVKLLVKFGANVNQREGIGG